MKFYALVSEGPIVSGQTLQVQYIVEGATDIQQFSIPPFSDFLVLDSFDNNSTSIQSPGLKKIEVYSKIVVLLARKTGRFTLPAASAIINGKKRKTNLVKIEVLSRKTPPLVIPESPGEEVAVEVTSQLREGENISDKIKKNLFLKTIVNKKSCYAGEALLLTYKMYSRMDASSQVQKRPSLSGLSVVEMVDSYDGKPEIEKLNGVSYYVNLIRKVQGFPLQPGIISLDRAEVTSTVHFIKIEEPVDNNVSDQRLKYSLYDYPVTLTTNPVDVEVKPLPANQPENFLGAVGVFSMHMEVSEKDIHPGDLVKIRLIITGKGNIPLLVPPPVQWPKGVDTAEPLVKEEFNKYVYPLQGSKSFEYSFTAPGTGIYIIPATNFFYFDPSKKTYQSSRSDSIKLQVTPGPGKNSALVKQTILDPDSDTTPRQVYWFAGVVFIILYWISYQVWKRKRDPQPTDDKKEIGLAGQIEIVKTDKLIAARAALQQAAIPVFYHELEKAIWMVIAETFHLSPTSLNKQNVSLILSKKGVSPEINQQLLEVLNECEWALYAPSHEQKDAENLFAKANDIVEKLSVAQITWP